MATSDYHSSADLKAVEFGGLIREDVMDQIFDLSRIPLELTDRIGSDSIGNTPYSWSQDRLRDPDLGNAKVDGEDASDTDNDANTGRRVLNHAQISTKELYVTQRARASDTIGRSDELSYQVMMRQRELRRDVEAIMLTNQASQADDGDTVPGLVGALGSWLETNTFRGVGGADGGAGAAGTTAPTDGTERALTETLVRDMAQAIYEQGGNATVLMSIPAVIRGFSEYLFTSSARIATQTTEAGKSSPSKAVGSIGVFLSDFGSILELVANRLQQPVTTGPNRANVYGIDPALLRQSFLHGYRTETLGKPGLSDKRQISVDWGFKVLNEEGLGVIADVDWELPVTQS
jgi:hypothetical protein